jgi:leucyl aminopeptidase
VSKVTLSVRIAASSDPLASSDADVLAVGVFDGETPDSEPAAALLSRGEARTSARHVAVTHVGEQPLIVAGLGPRDAFDGEAARRVAAAVTRRARELGARHLAVQLPGETGPEIAEGIVLGVALTAYRFDRFLPAESSEDDDGVRLQALTVAGADTAQTRAAVDRAAVLAGAQNRARDLGNRPPNDLSPAELARYATELADRCDALSCEVTPGDELRARGMGAFAAVAQGSEQPAQMITLRYEGPGTTTDAPRLALVGKAVTFDSGGLNIKSGAGMLGMKYDMCGGAAVIEAVAALAELGAPIRLLAVVGATENMISGAAMRVGDILTAYDGTTIEMNNADAEGRLVLADCITHARREGCTAIVDVATLTGAAVVALGSVYAGLMANDDALAEQISACGARTGELVWRLPLHPAYAEMTKGRYATLKNRPEPRGEAGAITAAEFLHHFAGDTPWAHLDIAGVGDDGKAPYLDKGGTGFGVRLLTELALGFSL